MSIILIIITYTINNFETKKKNSYAPLIQRKHRKGRPFESNLNFMGFPR